MTPQQFVVKWKKADLSERSACQQHFLDLCEMLGEAKPAEADPTGEFYTFENTTAAYSCFVGPSLVFLFPKLRRITCSN